MSKIIGQIRERSQIVKYLSILHKADKGTICNEHDGLLNTVRNIFQMIKVKIYYRINLIRFLLVNI